VELAIEQGKKPRKPAYGKAQPERLPKAARLAVRAAQAFAPKRPRHDKT